MSSPRDSLRLVSMAFVACLAVGALSACVVEEKGIDAYPGSSIGPGQRTDNGQYLYLQQIYFSPDSYGEVVQFYEAYVAKEPGWEGGRASGQSSWTKNMKVRRMGGTASGEPIDPTKEAGAIIVANESSRTVIRTIAAYPNTPK